MNKLQKQFQSTITAPQLGGRRAQRSGMEPRLGSTLAPRKIISGLGADDPLVRMRCVDLLVAYGDAAVADVLHALEDNSVTVRTLAALVCGRIADNRLAPALLAALDDPEQAVRIAAVEALGKLPLAEAPDRLFTLLNTEEPQALHVVTCAALGRLDDARALPELLDVLENGNRFVREAAAEALGQIGNPCAIPGLRRAFRDEHGLVREAAYEALHLIQRD